MGTIPTIHRSGKIFGEGAYGVKGTYTAADIDAMVYGALPPIRMGHSPTLLEKSGALGVVKRLFSGFDAAGKRALFADWDEPLPLSQLLGDIPRTLSVEIDIATKKLRALALEVTPHIADCAFFSQQVDQAYAKFSKGEVIEPLTPVSEARRRELLSMTPAGVLALNKEIADGIIARRQAEANPSANFWAGSIMSVVDAQIAKDRQAIIAMLKN